MTASMIMMAELVLLMALNVNNVNVTVAQNTSNCPVINGVVRCDLKGKSCRYVNGNYVCEK